jgi:hypothetical protein
MARALQDDVPIVWSRATQLFTQRSATVSTYRKPPGAVPRKPRSPTATVEPDAHDGHGSWESQSFNRCSKPNACVCSPQLKSVPSTPHYKPGCQAAVMASVHLAPHHRPVHGAHSDSAALCSVCPGLGSLIATAGTTAGRLHIARCVIAPSSCWDNELQDVPASNQEPKWQNDCHNAQVLAASATSRPERLPATEVRLKSSERHLG